jgi:hypothetical protein
MSDKLTPEDLKAWPRKLGTTPLLEHIAAVEAERDALAAALSGLFDERWWWALEGDDGNCIYCGGKDEHHSLDNDHVCPIPAARAALAKVEGETP